MTEDEEREKKLMNRARDLGLTFRVLSHRRFELRDQNNQCITHGPHDEVQAFLSGAEWEREAEDKLCKKLDELVERKRARGVS